ncbi:hypothetical protein K491DRAFT_595255 [Lophiostoma macrostomum CBS 122681]|uniref:Uncharacterized protein n=1 Tax=Lophiostoma macrostomum CBS 122681 TaxID=1314788 RepID=A0A6A6TBK9_9PLEO|nr:hypothetical protein K491DRAFT_595255 [Lophiostoma macrostomum CBS 122681]
MSREQIGENGNVHPDTDFAQAFKDLARGERAAAALENHLDSLEKKIEELLAKADEDEKQMKRQPEETTDKAQTSNNDSKDAA